MTEAFVCRAVDEADLNALRMALIQATGDPEVLAMQPEETGSLPTIRIELCREDQERVKDLAVQYLRSGATDHVRVVPSPAELDRLVQLAHPHPIPSKNLTMRRNLLAFGEHPLAASWSRERPRLPPGFHIVIVGAGLSGIGMAVQLQKLGLPYTIFERRNEVGGVWSINTYPDARVDTLSSTYQFSFEKNYPWSEHFAR